MTTKTITVRHGDPDPNPTCQHRRIDDDTARCRACDEHMITVTSKCETVLSGGPNAAGCINSACLAALDDGSYDRDDPPPGCTNPSGMYVPTYTPPRPIVIATMNHYQCERCAANSNTITMEHKRHIIWPCGGRHEGARVEVEEHDAE